jgi:hypothetical protein
MSDVKKYALSLIRQCLLLIITLMLLFVGFVLMAIIAGFPNDEFPPEEEQFITEEASEVIEIIEYDAKIEYVPIEIDIRTSAQSEYFLKMLELDCGEISKQEWYESYKKLVEEYGEYLETPETVYDVFTDEEIYLIQRVVETETYQCGFDSKVNVASVIFNRIKDGRFGNSVKDVITRPGQFAYGKKSVSETTVLAVEFAYEIGDTTGGCIAFRSDRRPEKWGKWVYHFSDSAVHHFYKEQE